MAYHYEGEHLKVCIRNVAIKNPQHALQFEITQDKAGTKQIRRHFCYFDLPIQEIQLLIAAIDGRDNLNRIAEAEANARLIAAAPNMFKACKGSTAPHWLLRWQEWAEDMATKPTLAVYRQQFRDLATLLKRTAQSAEEIMQAIAKVEGS